MLINSVKKRELDNALDQFPSQPCILLLIGLPGCGKSTFAEYFVSMQSNAWAVGCQDTLGSRKRVITFIKNEILRKTCVIIDRCNFNEDQRKTWIDIANFFGIPAFAVVLPNADDLEFCAFRATQRGVDATHSQNDWYRICSTMKRDFTLPSLEEGFETIFTCHGKDDLAKVTASFSRAQNDTTSSHPHVVV